MRRRAGGCARARGGAAERSAGGGGAPRAERRREPAAAAADTLLQCLPPLRDALLAAFRLTRSLVEGLEAVRTLERSQELLRQTRPFSDAQHAANELQQKLAALADALRQAAPALA
ncbi:MAG: hypothetical protein ACK4F6_19215, partial [Hylemonella sp.]